jgi:transcription factor SPT20
LIVEVRDHRPRGQPANTTSRGGPFITPSQNANTAPSRPATVQSKEPPRIYKTLLRPTEQSLWQDFGQLADTSGGEFTDWMGLQVEGGLMVSPILSFSNDKLAMHPRLVLETPRPGVPRKRIFEKVLDQTSTLPPRKKVKRESSKALDDSAERAAEEKLMLLGDLKHDKDFQPRYPKSLILLIIDSKFWFTERNGRRRKQRKKRIRQQMETKICLLFMIRRFLELSRDLLQ